MMMDYFKIVTIGNGSFSESDTYYRVYYKKFGMPGRYKRFRHRASAEAFVERCLGEPWEYEDVGEIEEFDFG